VSKISPDLFVEVLFPDPTLISRSNKGNTNSGEYYYADSTREMRIRQKETKLEFYNPNSTENASGDIGPIELIDLSISRINSHKGWFNDYKLYELNTTNNSVTYQMQYNGYPVHNKNGLTFIETEYEGQDIYRYSRSLLSLGREVQTEQVEVPSGAKIIAYLMGNLNDTVDIKDIENIQLGYYFQYQEDNSVILEPAWFMQVNGDWQKILFKGYLILHIGGIKACNGVRLKHYLFYVS
jgi:regulatory protein YycH of two-component signal transduction system YycFG